MTDFSDSGVCSSSVGRSSNAVTVSVGHAVGDGDSGQDETGGEHAADARDEHEGEEEGQRLEDVDLSAALARRVRHAVRVVGAPVTSPRIGPVPSDLHGTCTCARVDPRPVSHVSSPGRASI